MMSPVTLLGTMVALLLWAMATASLVARPLPGAPRAPSAGRRALVFLACVAAGVGGCWGPPVQSSTEIELGEATGSPATTVTRGFRTLVVTGSRSMDLSPEGVRIRETRVRTYHVPVTLLALFGWAGWGALRRTRPRSTGRLMVVGASLLALPACGGEAEVLERASRQIHEVRWDTLAVIESFPEDTLFYDVRRVAADVHGIRVLDGAGSRIVKLDWSGQLRWYAGRPGSGPGEFRNPRALAVDGAGVTWVLDVETHRITGFNRGGAMMAEVPLLELDFVPHEFAVAPSGDRFFMARPEGGIRPVEVRRDGRARTGSLFRFPGSRDAAPLALQANVRSGGVGERWVMALNMGDGLIRFEGLDPLDGFVPFVEPVPLAEVEVTVEGDPRTGNFSRTQRMLEPIFASRSMAVTGSRILVRFGGRTEDRERLLDIYGMEDGRYQGSLILPTAGSLAAWDDRIVLGRNAPHPTLLVLRPREWP